MQLSTHELYQLNELTMSCVNSLTNFKKSRKRICLVSNGNGPS